MATKISLVIKAGKSLENNKTGFTIPDLMNELNWSETERFYVQNAMSLLARKGKAKKLGPQKPIVYSFKGLDGIGKGRRPPTTPSRPQETAARTPAIETEGQNRPKLTFEDISQMGISLELIGEGMVHLNEQLKRQNSELELKIAEMKRHLDTAMKRIDEQGATIEEQNRTISNLKRDRDLLSRLRKPIIQKKRVR